MVLFRIAYAPAYFLLFVGGAAMLVSSGAAPIWLVALLLAAIAISLVAERVAPFERHWNQNHGDTPRDIAHALVNEGSILILVLLLPLFASLVTWPSMWPAALPFWAQLLLAIILLDAGISLAHFASHRIPLLWRFNCVYHSLRCSSDYPTDYFEQLIETFRPAGPVTSKDAKASAGLQQ